MKLKTALLALLVGISTALADMVVPANSLPAAAQNFINTYFKGVAIGMVERDMNSFDVVLTDGTKIDFNINGEWTNVDGKYKPIPTGFVPANVLAKAKATQPNAAIIEVDKEWGGYKFEFNNRMKVYVDNNGNVLGQKFDD